ncbi:MAG: 2-C-methyl-D-erythritol 4-phosphate cytidylyltransferase [Erysipelotrichia bacterium]|jgi:2-C-methyl-D-erythritol 4-phosphate cytidylyltransferase|nr:2-C-methyl-D-erythritol 4-phosphate cytidylyltransferase [Erysipelotrichia bacterium]
MNYAVLLLAAGKGTRSGLGYDKMFMVLKNGKTVLQHSMELFLSDPRCQEIVVVTNKKDMPKILKSAESGHVVMVNGGVRRQDSVINGLMAIKEETVLIHDGARPYLSLDEIDALLEAMNTEEAAILGVAPRGSVKKVVDGYISKSIDKTTHVIAQTPQAFRTQFIIKCYLKAEQMRLEADDDAEIVELVSQAKIKVVLGSRNNERINVVS